MNPLSASRIELDAIRAAWLSAATSHPLIARLQARLVTRSTIDAPIRPESRLAAVAAMMRVRDEPELLFIKRADAAGDPWSGHVALPGGRHETGDATLEQTAVRETFEELSIDIGTRGQMIGRLDDIAPNSPQLPPVIIRPFVGLLSPDVSFTLSREVADAFWVPVQQLQLPAAQAEHVLPLSGGQARFPAYAVGPHVIWGITERIIRQLLTLVD